MLNLYVQISELPVAIRSCYVLNFELGQGQVWWRIIPATIFFCGWLLLGVQNMGLKEHCHVASELAFSLSCILVLSLMSCCSFLLWYKVHVFVQSTWGRLCDTLVVALYFVEKLVSCVFIISIICLFFLVLSCSICLLCMLHSACFYWRLEVGEYEIFQTQIEYE